MFWGCFCLAAKSCVTLCDPMDCSMPGFHVLHCLLEFTQTLVCWVGDAIGDWSVIGTSSSVTPFSSCPQSFPAWGSFPMNWLLTSGGQSIGASPSASVLPMNIQGWSPLGLTGLISLLSKGLKSLLQHQSSKASVLWSSAFFMAQLSQPYMTTGKTIALAIQSFVYKVMSLLFNMLSRFVITFLSMNKCLFLLISWLQSPSAVILEPNNIKSVTVSTFPLSIKWWNQMPSWS